MNFYAADGSTNVTVVDGTTYVGAYAADGSINVFQVDGTTAVPLKHASGALNVFVTTAADDPLALGGQHPCGAANVSVSPYVSETVKVTVVTGAFV